MSQIGQLNWVSVANGGMRLYRPNGTLNVEIFSTGAIANYASDGTTVLSIIASDGSILIPDGITAPSATVGAATLYVDVADGDLKVKFGDGVTKVISADT